MIYSILKKEKKNPHTLSLLFLWLTSVKDDLHFNFMFCLEASNWVESSTSRRRRCSGWVWGGRWLLGGEGNQSWLSSCRKPQQQYRHVGVRSSLTTNPEFLTAHVSGSVQRCDVSFIIFFYFVFLFALLERQMYVSDTKDSWQLEMMSHKHFWTVCGRSSITWSTFSGGGWKLSYWYSRKLWI